MPVEVTVSTFRSQLKQWLERAKDGEELLVTDRGSPIARVLGIDAEPGFERLIDEGVVITPPRSARRTKASGRPRVRASGPVSALISEQRR